MSSDDSGDSGFDKEAEREKLREKYEQDQKDRENTQRMSELLLQGATMTGKHCGECGDPIFRYDGQEFCPTCQHEVEEGAGEQGASERGEGEAGADERDADQQAASDGAADGQDAVNETADGETHEGSTDEEPIDDEPRVELNDVRVADQHADRSNLRQPPSQQGERAGRNPRNASRSDEESRMRRHSRDHHSAANSRGSAGDADASPRDAGDLATARESLVRKLTDLARRAEETDDVARSRDLLAATREAAEALAALDRATR